MFFTQEKSIAYIHIIDLLGKLFTHVLAIEMTTARMNCTYYKVKKCLNIAFAPAVWDFL